jgi:UDP-N-acetylglucosamine 4,6-dehydratase
VVGVGTDKAVSPLNTYGATKLLMEKLLTTAQNYLDKEKYKTKFLAVRYGNVLGSSGSVLPKFVNQIRNKQKITITDPNMTRFSLTMDEAIDHILSSTLLGKISEVFIPKARSYTITDLKEALFELLEDTGEDIISSRPGEKKHEILINSDEAKFAWEFDNKYVIFNPFRNEDEIKSAHPGIKKANFLIDYTSEMVEKIPKNELKQIITDCGFLK